jgi:hypothetical protein
MSSDSTDPIAAIVKNMTVAGYRPEIIMAWEHAARARHDWKEAKRAPDKPDTARVWEANYQGWHLVLADFPVDDQPGFSPGDRGQNLAMSHREWGLVMMSDGAAWHELAALLHRQVLDFIGAGQVPIGGEALEEQIAQAQLAKGDLDLRNPAQLRQAVLWTQDLIARLPKDPHDWQVPREGTVVRIWREQKRVEVLKGPIAMPARVAFYACGFAVQEEGIPEHDLMMCRLWASLYQQKYGPAKN